MAWSRHFNAAAACWLAAALALAWIVARRLDRLYESERAARRQAEEASQAREDLLGVVAHDLRSPLSALLLQGARIRRLATEPKVRHAAEAIESVAMRMDRLIRSLLDAAQIEAARFSLKRGRCPIERVVAGALEVLAVLAAEGAVTIEQAIDVPDAVLLADEERLIQVLTNLLSNALKATPRGGRIVVRARGAGASVRFEVCDHGAGIPRQLVPRIFDRYWKADAGGRRGNGLGLFIAQGIVAAHGGHIWVDTDDGHGATFAFEIPLAPPEPPARAPPSERGLELHV